MSLGNLALRAIFLVSLAPLDPIILPWPLLQYLLSSAYCLVIDLCICSCQLLDKISFMMMRENPHLILSAGLGTIICIPQRHRIESNMTDKKKKVNEMSSNDTVPYSRTRGLLYTVLTSRLSSYSVPYSVYQPNLVNPLDLIVPSPYPAFRYAYLYSLSYRNLTCLHHPKLSGLIRCYSLYADPNLMSAEDHSVLTPSSHYKA